MSLIWTFLVVFFVHRALSNDVLIRPCGKNDIDCLTNAAQSFLGKTSAGVPQLDIRPIDPMFIPSINTSLESGEKIYLNNVTVTGLKKLIIHDFKIDTSKKSVLLAMEGDPEIVTDIEVEGKDFKLSGTFSAKGNVIPTAKYTYDLVPNESGVEYFTVGPETITCNLSSSPEITVDSDIEKVLRKDSTKTEEIKKTIICSVIIPAFHTVIHNLRQSAKIYPKTSYFSDL